MSMIKADRAHNCGLVKDPALMANDVDERAGRYGDAKNNELFMVISGY